MKKNKTIGLLTILSVFLVVFACNEDTDEQNLSRFDLSTYNSLKQEVTNLEPLDLEKINSAFKDLSLNQRNDTDIKQIIVDEVNETFEEPVLQIEAVEYVEYEGEEILAKGLEDGIFTELDIEIANDLASDMVNDGVDIAIQNMEDKLIQYGSTQSEFDRYNQLANQLLLNIEGINSTPDMNFEPGDTAGPGWRCALAITAFTLATVAVGVACVPNPVSPLACPLAVTQASIAYTAMILACKKDTPQINDI